MKNIDEIKKLASSYIAMENKMSYADGADYTTRGVKSAATRRYNKFVDACEDFGMTLNEQVAILKEAREQ